MKGQGLYWKLVQKKDDYVETFSSDHGKRVLNDHLKACGVFGRTHVSGDPHDSAFNNGMREGALRLVRQMGLSEEELMRMANERAK